MENQITKTHLENGLTILLKEIHTAPIISNWIWYRVGSRNEIPGLTGISHWVEHMQFKGTSQFPPEVMDKAISREGGYWNAFTYLDWTTFFETMPAGKADIALRLEADRMVNSSYAPDEVASERTVIISEREGKENEPLFLLGENVQQAAFQIHPYRHEIIGAMDDLKSMTRDDLFGHYRDNYAPNHAVLAIAGDFETSVMLARVSELFGAIPRSSSTALTIPIEPPAQTEQRLVVNGPGETTFIQASYRAPAASNPDFFSFSVLDSLLSGPSGLNMFGGGGISNKTSRLYKSLVEKELAIGVHGGLQATIDPFLYDILITVHPDKSPDAVLAALDQEIKRLQDHPVTPEEIQRATKQAKALFAYGSENITNQGFWLGYAEMFAQYDWFLGYIDHLAAITPDDIQRIAQTYLRPDYRVIGTYLPSEKGETHS